MATNDDDNADCWDAFGDDDEDDSDDSPQESSSYDSLVRTGVLFLTQQFLMQDPQILLSQRRVRLVVNDPDDTIHDDEPASSSLLLSVWIDNLQQHRGVHCVGPDELCDAAVIVTMKNIEQETDDERNRSATMMEKEESLARRSVVAGGILLLVSDSHETVSGKIQALDGRVWNTVNVHQVNNNNGSSQQQKQPQQLTTLTAVFKHACPINERSCVWKANSRDGPAQERALLQEAVVTRSAYEIIHKRPLTLHQVHQASDKLTTHGYCVVRNLLNVEQCKAWGQAVLSDFQQASDILRQRDGVDLRHPFSSTCEPQSYKEMAMREDLRMDLRDGPGIRRMRASEARNYRQWGIGSNTHGEDESVQHDGNSFVSNAPIITTADGSQDSCLRFQADVLEIARRTMNPKNAGLFKGNLGRFNFDGSGPDGSYQPLRIGPMGGILSLPGSADQALHADTPHLFEHLDCLPAHYINTFALGADAEVERDSDGSATGSTDVGGTAFVHGSHRLSFTAKIATDPSDSSSGLLSSSGRGIMHRHLVRPSLQLGDVILFDCRILHFGLANNSSTIERPMLYINLTHAFFHDPKNWDDRKSIFEE